MNDRWDDEMGEIVGLKIERIGKWRFVVVRW